MKNQKLTCNKAKKLSIIDVLNKLGNSPIKETRNDTWFLSPFRKETKASFKVSKKLNSWFDHGLGKGGNVIDLIIELKGYSVKETLEFLSVDLSSFSFHQQTNILSEKVKNNYEIIKIKDLENGALLDYLSSRKINLEIAKKFCQEVYYKMNNKNYFAICFKNNTEGIEIRNKYFKGCLGNKDITLIKNKNHSKNINVFEGFFDFLSYKVLKINTEVESDFLILNSISLIEKATKILNNYDLIYTFLDNDISGENAVKELKNININIKDMSYLYKNFKDLNEFLVISKSVNK